MNFDYSRFCLDDKRNILIIIDKRRASDRKSAHSGTPSLFALSSIRKNHILQEVKC